MTDIENARCDTGALTAWRRVEANNTPRYCETQQAGRSARETDGDENGNAVADLLIDEGDAITTAELNFAYRWRR